MTLSFDFLGKLVIYQFYPYTPPISFTSMSPDEYHAWMLQFTNGGERMNHEVTVAVHQPNYLPWTGYFYKMLKSDIFVFLDNVQYSKNSFINRNKIKGQQGAQWLTVPIHGSTHKNIDEIECADRHWAEKHMRTLDTCYAKAPYYELYRPKLFEIYETMNTRNLSQLNKALIGQIAGWLQIPCQIRSTSEFTLSDASDGRLIEIAQRVGGHIYLSGQGAAAYQDAKKFEDAGITLQYYDFSPPTYPQLYEGFESHLSVVD